jgi:hypothetical protein
MQKTNKKPLTLDKESLRLLSSRDLANARGGVGGDTQTCTHCSDQAIVTTGPDKSMISECPTCTSC